MRTMAGMARRRRPLGTQKPLSTQKQIRVNDDAWGALKRSLAALTGRVGWEGRDLTQEAFVCASWLWMESLGPDALAAALAPHVRRLEAIVAGEDDPGTSPARPAEGQGVADLLSPPTGARLAAGTDELAG